MKVTSTLINRPTALVAAAGLLLTAIAPVFSMSMVHADPGQVQTRSIQMSNSATSATGVKYTVSFKVATTGVIQGVDVDFCGGNASDTPIIGDSNCTIPTGMSLSGVTATSPVTGLSPTTGWTAAVVNSAHTAALTNASGASVSSGATVTFELNGITNPSAAGTFYARITTFATSGAASSYTSATPGAYVDYGGVALSTASPISVTAKVMETLTFCVSGSAIATDCSGSLTTPALTIGKTVGSNIILDSAAVYTANAYTQTSTNALGGVTVRLKTTGSATCAGLSSDGGSTCTKIPAVASGATTPQAITPGTAAFGMCVTPGSAGTTAAAPYNNVGCTSYGMDDSSATKTTSTYGSPIFSSASAVNKENDTLKYAATASLTTPAGIYSTNQALIATGTF
jgi:hypothetical protein